MVHFFKLLLARTSIQFLHLDDVGEQELPELEVNNKFLLVAVGLAFGLHLLTIYFPPMAAVFQFTPIGGEEWGLMLLAVGIGVVLLDVTKIALHHVKRLQ